MARTMHCVLLLALVLLGAGWGTEAASNKKRLNIGYVASVLRGHMADMKRIV